MSATHFFFKHAGYSYNPKTETPNQGRWRCARQLAEAEAWAERHGLTVEWRDDWLIGSHIEEYGESYPEEPQTCECATLTDPRNGSTLSSLGCIDDATDDYRRVIAAELALEAMAYVKNLAECATESAQ